MPTIACIGTDANSCYAVAFARAGVPEPHVVTKAQTHVIESPTVVFGTISRDLTAVPSGTPSRGSYWM